MLKLDAKLCRDENNLTSDKERRICSHLSSRIAKTSKVKSYCQRFGGKELGYSGKYHDYLRCAECLTSDKEIQKKVKAL